MSMPGSPFHGSMRPMSHETNYKTVSESALVIEKKSIYENIGTKDNKLISTDADFPSISIDNRFQIPTDSNNTCDTKLIPAKRRILSFDDRRTNSLPHHYKSRPSSLLNSIATSDNAAMKTVLSKQSQTTFSEFRKQLKMITNCFMKFTDEQRTIAFQNVVPYLGSSQLHYLSNKLPNGNLHALCNRGCSDFLPHLPEQISSKILNYLDPVSLVNASMVCNNWHSLIESTWIVWKKLCYLPEWQLSYQANIEQLEKYSMNTTKHYSENDNQLAQKWKSIFIERFKLRRAWLRGRCHVRTFEGHSGGISCVQFDGSRIVSGSHDKTIRVWNIKTNSKWSVLTLAGHSGEVRCLHLESGGNRLVSGSTDATIKVWDLDIQKEWSSIGCRVTMVGHTDTVRCVHMSTKRGLVISGSYDNTLRLWCLKTGSCSSVLRGHNGHVLCIYVPSEKDDQKISSSNKNSNTDDIVLSGSSDMTIKVWSFKTCQNIMTLVGHCDAVTCLSLTDSERIISGSLDRTIKLWDLRTGYCCRSLDWMSSEGHTGVVRCLQADFWRIVSAADDKTIKVWGLESTQRLVTLRSHSDGVTCLQFNDFFIVSGSYDKTVKLWDFTVYTPCFGVGPGRGKDLIMEKVEKRKKNAKTSTEKKMDPTMDFFNLGASFKPQVIKTSKEIIDHSKKPTAPPIISQDDDDEFYDCVETSTGVEKTRNEFKYAKEIKATEMKMYKLLREKEDRKKKIHNRSSLSNIEDNTVSILEKPSRIPDDTHLGRYFDFTKKRCVELAIAKDEEAIIDLIRKERVTIICGHTGSGKTTQVPQFILDDHARRGKSVNILVTQPRKIAAKSIAKRICQERNWEMGRIVGYKVGLDKENASLDTRLLFCTTGIFKKMIIAKKNLNDWTHIILDEVHEREMDMDFVLLLCKRLINTNSSNVKLILMSATIDTARFQKYFSWSGPDAERGCHYTAGVYSMKETNKYSVKEIYLDELEKDKKIKNNISAWPYNFEVESPYVIDECVNIASQIILKLSDLEQKKNIKEQGAVLVFLPGEAEIARVKKCFHEISKNYQVPWWLLPLHSRIPFEETQRIFDVKKGHRKVILSTNVAESSLTIPDVCYVIDFCLQKLIMADQYTNYVSLKLQWADKNSCTQRKGRAGRVRSGVVFRLVPKEFYDMLDECVTAEMIRAPLEKVILDTKLLDFGPPRELLALAMDPPKLKNIHNTTMRLKEIGALQTTTDGSVNLDDGDLTVLGEIIASLPVDISLGKLIALGHILNILDECIIIAAGMSNNSLFSMPFGRKLKAFADKLCWSNNSFSDCLAILVAYQTWNRKLRTGEFNRIPEVKWCQERHLQVKVLHEMREAIDDIKLALQRHHIDILDLPNRCDRRQYNADHMISSSDKDILKLKIAIFGAFYPNYFVRTGLGLEEKEVYKELYNNTTSNYHDPCSCVYFSNFDPQQTPFSSLYVDQIKSMFDGIDSRNINVEFDRQKIIVQFANDTGRRNVIFADHNTYRHSTSIINESVIKNCDILQEVYIAMKLRREPSEMMRLKLFPPEVAQQKMIFIDQHIRELHLSSNRIILYQDIGIRNPPALAQSILHLEINYANNPNSFWINYLSPENQNANDNQLANLDTEIENIMASKNYLKTIDANNIEINQLFLAPYEGMYYRARVDSVIESDKSIKAFFVDYGNIEIIHMSELLVIDTDLTNKFPLLTTPALAHECSLSFTKPNPRRKYDCGWDKYSVSQFKNIIECDNIQEPVTFVGKVLSVVPNVAMKAGHLIHLTLFKNTNHLAVNYDYKKSINYQFQCLKDGKGHHLAVYTAENYMSHLNSQLRESYNSFSDIERAEREKCQLSFIGDKSKKQLEDSILSASISNNKTRVDQRTMGVQLKGPYHPLQFSVNATHRIGSCKKASVEPDSVNSVLLDKSPNDRHDAWLVAGHVGTNPTGDSLVLRSTTLMPNIKGLGALLAMTFSPEVEMRYDSKMQKYTGCLLGLGSRKRRNFQSESKQTIRSSTYLEEDWNSYLNDTSEYVPYHSEHDMELQFDVNVDNDDISLINQLRYRLSIAFTRINQKREDGTLLPLEQRMREIPARLTISNYLIEDQDKIDELFDQLLSRKRKVIAKQHFRNENHWCQLPPARMLYHPHIHNEHELLLKMITQISFTNGKK